MSTETKLTRDEEGESVDNTKYRGMIGSLLYLMASRPDIMFSVCLCARFQEDPKTSHLKAVKRIFRYIKGTTHLRLWYPKESGIETIVYANSDHASDYVNRKITSGVCTFMGCCLTSWFSKKQTALAISITEAEYVSAEKACQQALWKKQALIEYVVRLDDIPIMCDNKGAIDLSKNPVQHSRTKHIEIRHHFLRDNFQKGNISIEKVLTYETDTDDIHTALREAEEEISLDPGLIVVVTVLELSCAKYNEDDVSNTFSLHIDEILRHTDQSGVEYYGADMCSTSVRGEEIGALSRTWVVVNRLLTAVSREEGESQVSVLRHMGLTMAQRVDIVRVTVVRILWEVGSDLHVAVVRYKSRDLGVRFLTEESELGGMIWGRVTVMRSGICCVTEDMSVVVSISRRSSTTLESTISSG
ncbi:hypothetical protein Tco_1165323 [Tanacetum coccineum]